MLKKILLYMRYFFLKRNKRIETEGFVSIQKGVEIILELDSKLLIGKGTVLKTGTIIYVKKGAKLSIGSYTSTGHHTEISCGNSINIGNNVIMGAYSYITDSDHVFEDPEKLIKSQGMSLGEVHIGDDIWIGRGVYILKNSKISNHSVVAAKAVVTKGFTNNTVIGGVPARKIKDI